MSHTKTGPGSGPAGRPKDDVAWPQRQLGFAGHEVALPFRTTNCERTGSDETQVGHGETVRTLLNRDAPRAPAPPSYLVNPTPPA